MLKLEGTSKDPITAPADANNAPENSATVLSTLITIVACSNSEAAVSVLHPSTGIRVHPGSISRVEGM